MKQNGNYRIQKLKFAVLTMLVCVLLLSQNFTVLTQAATARATTMKLDSFKGSVTVKTMNGSQRKASKGMRLLNGYEISTGKNSEAYINLDNTKAVKLDEGAKVQVRQSGKKLELMVKSGKIFFNVTQPLKADESMYVRSSTMVAGVRGTSGYVMIDQKQSKLYLLEGKIGLTKIDPVTSEAEIVEIKGGQVASSSRKIIQETEVVAVQVERFIEAQVPKFVLEEVVKDTKLQEKIDKEELSALSSEKLLEVKDCYDQGMTVEEVEEKYSEEIKQNEERNKAEQRENDEQQEEMVEEPVPVPSASTGTNSGTTPSVPEFEIRFVDANGEETTSITQVGYDPNVHMNGGIRIAYHVYHKGQKLQDSVSPMNENLYRPSYQLDVQPVEAGATFENGTDGWGYPCLTYPSSSNPVGTYQLRVSLCDPVDGKTVLASKTLTYVIAQAATSDAFIYTISNDKIVLEKIQTDTITNIVLPSSIAGRSVVALGYNLFQGNTNIQTVDIQSNVKTLPHMAFVNCTALKTVKLPDSLTSFDISWFSGCTGLTSITYKGVTYPSAEDLDYALKNGISGVVKPEEIFSYIGSDDADSVTIYSLTEKGKTLKYITIPKELDGKPVSAITSPLFFSNQTIESVTIEADLVELPESMFSHATGLKEVNFWNSAPSLTMIGDSAFWECDNLTSISIPNSVEVIGEHAFQYCTNLTTVRMPQNLEFIGLGAFYNCSKLESLYMATSSSSVQNVYIGNEAFSGCVSMTEINLPSKLAGMGMGVFDGCSSTLRYLQNYKETSLADLEANYQYKVYFLNNDDEPITEVSGSGIAGGTTLWRRPIKYSVVIKGQTIDNPTVETAGAIHYVPRYTLLSKPEGSNGMFAVNASDPSVIWGEPNFYWDKLGAYILRIDLLSPDQKYCIATSCLTYTRN